MEMFAGSIHGLRPNNHSENQHPIEQTICKETLTLQ